MRFQLSYFDDDNCPLESVKVEASNLSAAAHQAANRQHPRAAWKLILTKVEEPRAPLRMQGRGPLGKLS